MTLLDASAGDLFASVSKGGRCGRERPTEVGAGGRQSRPQQGGGFLPPLDDSMFPNEVLCCLGAWRIGC